MSGTVSRFTFIDMVSDDELIRTGKAVCDDLDSGMTLTELGLEWTAEVGVGSEESSDIGWLFGAAIPAYCPEHKSDFEEFASTDFSIEPPPDDEPESIDPGDFIVRLNILEDQEECPLMTVKPEVSESVTVYHSDYTLTYEVHGVGWPNHL